MTRAEAYDIAFKKLVDKLRMESLHKASYLIAAYDPGFKCLTEGERSVRIRSELEARGLRVFA